MTSRDLQGTRTPPPRLTNSCLSISKLKGPMIDLTPEEVKRIIFVACCWRHHQLQLGLDPETVWKGPSPFQWLSSWVVIQLNLASEISRPVLSIVLIGRLFSSSAINQCPRFQYRALDDL
jgi:hypothetical protein